ncbi:MAG TPA: transglycosylase domain-containing protein, partial [Dehalococcoidia bacterium]|nr:transglycosylase domain-containing protein [Dehalococcoidia bacterium]
MARFFKRRRRVYLRGNGKTGLRRWMLVPLILFGVFAGGSAVTAVAGFITYRVYASKMAPIEEVLSQNAGGAKIYDRNGRLLYEYVDDLQGLRKPVPLSEMSWHLVNATIATEDASFYSNPGVNMKGLLRAAYENFLPGNLEFLQGTGGSSITQQLVKNIYIPEAERQKRSIPRKLKETVYAIELTNRYSKNQILQWYLNQIPYGGIYNGVEAAAQGYFGKKANELTLGEAALLAGIPACPSCYNPLENPESALARRNQVLLLMQEKDFITKIEGWVAAQEPLNLTAHRFLIDAPHWVLSYVGPEIEDMFGRQAVYREGLRVTTTLDLDLQKKAEEILENWIGEYEYSGGHNGALVAMDPTTGEILTYVGSRDYFRDDILGQNDMASAFNSPGSAMKPFTYVTTFMKLGWGPGTLILDTPTCYQDGDKQFCPRNPSGDYHGPISIRTALGNSLNIPAFKAIQAAGVADVVNTSKKMGITGLEGTYGPSFTIGGVDVKLVDMVYGYGVFAANGVMRGVPTVRDLPEGNRELEPISILKVEDSNGNVIYDAANERLDLELVPPEYTYLISSILSDPQAQCITFGCGGLNVPGQHAAIKTGTSEPYENSRAIGDTWAMVYTPNLVVGVWAGNADNSPMYNISSTSISWRSARDFMETALEGKEALDFEQPPGIEKAKICVPSGLLPSAYCGKTIEDLFVKNSLPTEKDNWWQPFKIDIRTGLLATEMTPPQFVQERVFLVLPPELSGFDKQQALEWAAALGVSLPPTERSNPSSPSDLPAVISSPAAGASVSGVVTVKGRAASSSFLSYRLEYGTGASPSEWIVIAESNTPVT